MREGGCHGKHCVGEALYKNDVNGTGWAYLELQTRDTASDVVQVEIIKPKIIFLLIILIFAEPGL